MAEWKGGHKKQCGWIIKIANHQPDSITQPLSDRNPEALKKVTESTQALKNHDSLSLSK